MNNSDNRVNVLGVGVSATSMSRAVEGLVEMRRRGERGYVCVTSVHGVMESLSDEALRAIHNRSLMTVPDGMPTVWMGREYGFVRMGRVYGPDLMLRLCEATANDKPLTHFLYGATKETISGLKGNLERKFPGIQIVGSYAPPFRPLTDEEQEDLQQQVAACKPDFLWVGLSTPKQERFMAEHHPIDGQVPLDCGIMLGVGAAFDIHAGNYADAPEWIKNSGLQWFYRLCKEPRRLWRRYLWIVPSFLWLSFLQVMGIRKWSLKGDVSDG